MGHHRRDLRWLGLMVITTLLVIFHPSTVYGQVDEGAITGTVTDASGAVVPNAQVLLANTDQGITLETKTNASGGYTFSPVRIGHYTVTVTAQGFAKTTQKSLTVNVAQVLQVNVQLKLGAATETVEVNTAPALLQTEEASVGQVIGQQTVNNLPLNGRNFTFLAQLGAGMQTPQADTRGNAASGAFSANGLRPAQNNYLLDGIDNNSNAVDFLNGTNFVILPPVDAIQEFKVQTANFSAELGRSAGAVMNATVKSGTNSLHGAAWEFFRNDVLDAADYFENNNGTKKGELRLNQFGASAGGPIIKNKLFFFGDYEGKRRVQGTSAVGNVPTNLERSSGFTDLTDILGFNSGSKQDGLGRKIPSGTILDPATTRFVANGAVDPVSGMQNSSGSAIYVRDPFGTCGPGTKDFTGGNCNLNHLPVNRLDKDAINILKLYPAPNSGTQRYSNSPNLYEHSNTFDVRGDFNPEEKDQIFVRFSFADVPQYIPGIFGGVADGGAFQQGIQTARSNQAVAGYTHVFNSATINQVRGGFAHLHTTRSGPEGGTDGIPAQYNILGIPQGQNNGGLPEFNIGNLASLGSNAFLPSDEVSQTLQVTDDFTKIYGKHSFKMGVEYQTVKFSTLQPAYSHGQFRYAGSFTDIPGLYNATDGSVSSTGGLPQMLLFPTAASTPNGFSYSGGADQVQASNISKTYDHKIYFASYFQDDWKVNSKLTLNLGLRWDYFGPIEETNGGQANFVPSGAPDNKPEFIIPATGKANRKLSTGTPTTPGTCVGIGCYGFVDLLAKDGIALLSTDKYGQGLLKTQKHNFAPRVGFAYEISPKLVARGGVGLFFNSFENQGYGPNIGENYPFVFNLGYTAQSNPADPTQASQVAPIKYNSPYSSCPTAGPGGTASFQSGFSCIPLVPEAVNALGVGLQGLQFDYTTPRTLSANLTFQYSMTHTLSATASYVMTKGSDLQGGVGYQNVSQILPAGISTKPLYVPFPDFGGGSYQATYGESIYNGLQTKLEKQVAGGLTFLLTYTYSKALSDARDLLNGTSADAQRAYAVPGLGPKFDWSNADFDIRHVVHFSGGYELPFGKDKPHMNTGGITNAILGGWATNWIVTLQGGQPLGFGCPTGTTSGTGCNVIRVKGVSPNLGIKLKTVGTDPVPRPFWINNPNAFAQACRLGGTPGNTFPIPGSPAGCIPLNGSGALGGTRGQIVGPGVHRFDFSMFKNFKFSERFSMQFRAEMFNILNHPNFNAPNFGGNGVVAIGGSGNITDPHFGEVGSTRFAPFDPRQIQFALKLYY